jgi:hypothetical protein
MHPELSRWAVAPDRYDASRWYRELGGQASAALAAMPADRHPLRLAVAAMRGYFGTYPTTLVPPGDDWTAAALTVALDLGLQLVASYYLALRDDDRFCWCAHVCAPYLDLPDASWFDAGLPVVGYFHDREPALEGPVWIERWLERWQAAGTRRLIDLRELAAVVGRGLCIEESRDELRLTVTGRGAPELVRPLNVIIRVPSGPLPSRVTASLDTIRLPLDVDPLDESLGCLTLPVSNPTWHGR